MDVRLLFARRGAKVFFEIGATPHTRLESVRTCRAASPSRRKSNRGGYPNARWDFATQKLSVTNFPPISRIVRLWRPGAEEARDERRASESVPKKA
jgi:hypothetical protein